MLSIFSWMNSSDTAAQAAPAEPAVAPLYDQAEQQRVAAQRAQARSALPASDLDLAAYQGLYGADDVDDGASVGSLDRAAPAADEAVDNAEAADDAASVGSLDRTNPAPELTQEVVVDEEVSKQFLREAAIDVFKYVPQLEDKQDQIRISLNATDDVDEQVAMIEDMAMLAARRKCNEDGGTEAVLRGRQKQITDKIESTIKAMAVQEKEQEGFTVRLSNIVIYYVALLLAGLNENDIDFAFSGSKTKFNLFDPKNPDSFLDNLNLALRNSNVSITRLPMLKLLPRIVGIVNENVHQHTDSILKYADDFIDAIAHSKDSPKEAAKVFRLAKQVLVELIPEFKGIMGEDNVSPQMAKMQAARVVLVPYVKDTSMFADLERRINLAETDEDKAAILDEFVGAVEGYANLQEGTLKRQIEGLSTSIGTGASKDEQRLAAERALVRMSGDGATIDLDNFLVGALVERDLSGFAQASQSVLTQLMRQNLMTLDTFNRAHWYIGAYGRGQIEDVIPYLHEVAAEVELKHNAHKKGFDERVEARMRLIISMIANEQAKAEVKAAHPKEKDEATLTKMQSEVTHEVFTVQLEKALQANGLDRAEFDAIHRKEMQTHKQYKMRIEAMSYGIDEEQQYDMMQQARVAVQKEFFDGEESYDLMVRERVVAAGVAAAMAENYFFDAAEVEKQIRKATAHLDVNVEEKTNEAYHKLFRLAVVDKKKMVYKQLCEGLCERFFKQKVDFIVPPTEFLDELWTFNINDNAITKTLKMIAFAVATVIYTVVWAILKGLSIDTAINKGVESFLRGNLVWILGGIVEGASASFVSNNGCRKSVFGALNKLLDSNLDMLSGEAAQAYEFGLTAPDAVAADVDLGLEADEDVAELGGILDGFLGLMKPEGRANHVRHALVASQVRGLDATIATYVRGTLRNGQMLKQSKSAVLQSLNAVFDGFNAEVSDQALERVQASEEEKTFYATSAKAIIKKLGIDNGGAALTLIADYAQGDIATGEMSAELDAKIVFEEGTFATNRGDYEDDIAQEIAYDARIAEASALLQEAKAAAMEAFAGTTDTEEIRALKADFEAKEAQLEEARRGLTEAAEGQLARAQADLQQAQAAIDTAILEVRRERQAVLVEGGGAVPQGRVTEEDVEKMLVVVRNEARAQVELAEEQLREAPRNVDRSIIIAFRDARRAHQEAIHAALNKPVEEKQADARAAFDQAKRAVDAKFDQACADARDAAGRAVSTMERLSFRAGNAVGVAQSVAGIVGGAALSSASDAARATITTIAQSERVQALASTAVDYTMGAALGDYVERSIEKATNFALNPYTIDALIHRGVISFTNHIESENEVERAARVEAKRRAFRNRKRVRYIRVGGPMGGAVVRRTE